MKPFPVILVVIEGLDPAGFTRLVSAMNASYGQTTVLSLSLPPPRFGEALEDSLLTSLRAHHHGRLVPDSSRAIQGSCLELLASSPGESVASAGWATLLPPFPIAYDPPDVAVMPDDIDASILREILSPPQLKHAGEELLEWARSILAEAFTTHLHITEAMERGEWTVASVRFVFPAHLCERFDLPESSGAGLLTMMVARLTQLAGPLHRMLLVSLRSESFSRPEPGAARAEAILAGCGLLPSAGPGGASILDIAPTLLASRGVAVPPKMEGKLLDAWLAMPTRRETSRRRRQTRLLPSPGPGPDHLEEHWNLACSLMDANLLEEASKHLDHVFQCYPEHPDYGRTHARCLLELKRPARAREVLEILKHYSHPPGALGVLDAWTCFLEKDSRRGIPLLDEVLRLDEINPSTALDLALLLYRIRDWQRLSRLSSRMATELPDDPLVRLGLSISSAAQGDLETSVAEARQAIDLRPDIPFAHTVLGSGLAKLGHLDEATASLWNALRLMPADPDTIRILANILEETGDIAAAASLRRQLVTKSQLDHR